NTQALTLLERLQTALAQEEEDRRRAASVAAAASREGPATGGSPAPPIKVARSAKPAKNEQPRPGIPEPRAATPKQNATKGGRPRVVYLGTAAAAILLAVVALAYLQRGRGGAPSLPDVPSSVAESAPASA